MRFGSQGQTIIEAVVALSIILFIMTSVSVVVISSLYNSQFIKEQNMANKYSQQGMEFVINLQKNDRDQLDLSTGTYCISGTSLTPCATPQNLPGSQNRIISLGRDLLPCVSGEMRVIVTTRWTSSKCGGGAFCHKSEVSSCLVYGPDSSP